MENVENNITVESRPNDCMPLKTKSNERLEFLGDSVLGLLVSTELFRRFPDSDEGSLTRCRARLVRQETLAAEVSTSRVVKG